MSGEQVKATARAETTFNPVSQIDPALAGWGLQRLRATLHPPPRAPARQADALISFVYLWACVCEQCSQE